jgi:hypothetical protein
MEGNDTCPHMALTNPGVTVTLTLRWGCKMQYPSCILLHLKVVERLRARLLSKNRGASSRIHLDVGCNIPVGGGVVQEHA